MLFKTAVWDVRGVGVTAVDIWVHCFVFKLKCQVSFKRTGPLCPPNYDMIRDSNLRSRTRIRISLFSESLNTTKDAPMRASGVVTVTLTVSQPRLTVYLCRELEG